jgi:hypothetical protein
LLTGQSLIGLGRFRNVGFVQFGIDFGRGHGLSFTPPCFSPATLYMGWMIWG